MGEPRELTIQIINQAETGISDKKFSVELEESVKNLLLQEFAVLVILRLKYDLI